MSIAVVTGAGSGLGKSLALALADSAYKVYGTATNDDQINDLNHLSNGKVILKKCDVTNHQDIHDFSDFIKSKEEAPIDVLINNVGILTPGPIEVLHINEIIHEFDVNTFGLIRFVNTFLPDLRQSKGHVIQISTISVDKPTAFNAPSSASKIAAEVFLRMYSEELKDFEINFSIAVCGNTKTGSVEKVISSLQKIDSEMKPHFSDIYSDGLKKFTNSIISSKDDGYDAKIAAQEIIAIIGKKDSPLRVPIGDEMREIFSHN